jgi:hypothetical protein
MRCYDVKRHWTRRIQPHLADEKLNAILVRDFKAPPAPSPTSAC